MPQCDCTQWKQSKAQIDSLKGESVIADNTVQSLELQVHSLKDELAIAENKTLTLERQADVLKAQVVMFENLATSAQPSTHLPLGWTQHQDVLGRWYYCNRSAGKAQWRPPINFELQVDSLMDQVAMLRKELKTSAQPSTQLRNELATSAQPSTHLPIDWTQHQDDDDQTYYVNRATCTSQWERPEVPPHAFWLASMPTLWQTGLIAPTDRAAGDCAWHCSQAADGNAAGLKHVVNEYNTIKSTEELNSLFTSMEVTLFRHDRQCWAKLQVAIEANFHQRKIVILNGKPKQNKWIHITCCSCGAFVYSPFGEASKRHDDTESCELRCNLFKFFMIEHRAPNLHLLPEV